MSENTHVLPIHINDRLAGYKILNLKVVFLHCEDYCCPISLLLVLLINVISV
jgi:hypothetical protein